jgi:hypothetical protein
MYVLMNFKGCWIIFSSITISRSFNRVIIVNKEFKNIISEYVSSLPEDVLRFLTGRLSERMSGDLSEALDEMSKSQKMDVVLVSANSGESFYAILDLIQECLQKECKKRNLSIKFSTVNS